jgi:hypothetical protein
MTTALSPQVLSEQTALQQRVASLTVTNDAENDLALQTVRDIKALKKNIEAYFAPMVESAHAAHKAMTKARGDATKPLDDMEAAIKAKVLPYATAKAAAEREAREAEQARLRQEAAAAREQAETAAIFGDETEAAALEAQAHILKHQAAAIVPGKAAGTRDNWKWRVADETLIPRSYLVPDKDRLDYEAKKGKGASSVPGIEFYNEPIVVVR